MRKLGTTPVRKVSNIVRARVGEMRIFAKTEMREIWPKKNRRIGAVKRVAEIEASSKEAKILGFFSRP